MAALRHLNTSSSRIAQAMERLSSGLRVNSAMDDPAGLAISERMRAQIRGLEQANRNIMDGLSLIQTIDGALNETHAILHRARELAVQWNNGTLGVQEKMAISLEWAQLSNQIAMIEQTTRFNGVQILADDTVTMTLQVGPNSGDTVSFNLAELFGPNVGDLVRPNTFFALPWLSSDIPGFDLHIDDVSSARGRFGAIANRLEYAMSANATYKESLMAAESRIRDVDVAKEMTALSKAQIMQQTGIAMLAQSHTNARMVLQLLQ